MSYSQHNFLPCSAVDQFPKSCKEDIGVTLHFWCQEVLYDIVCHVVESAWFFKVNAVYRKIVFL